MSKHTPGPWEIDEANPEMVTAGEYYICDCDGDFYQDLEQSEYEANACLIAAAPDMLEALIKCYKHIKNDMTVRGIVVEAKEAIERATGQKIEEVVK